MLYISDNFFLIFILSTHKCPSTFYFDNIVYYINTRFVYLRKFDRFKYTIYVFSIIFEINHVDVFLEIFLKCNLI